MVFDLDQRTATLSVGEFAAFAIGPRDAGTGAAAGLWRAQLGTHWHNELRTRTLAESPAAEFEVPLTGRLAHHGWTLTLAGRIDQLLRPPPLPKCHLIDDTPPRTLVREIKTVTRPLPADDSELRAAYPEYFAQLATYAALIRLGALVSQAPPPSSQLSTLNSQPPALRTELVFVETSSGLSQTVVLSPADDAFLQIQLARVTEFLDLRFRARERLRHLRYRPAFATPRPGQETTQAELTALFARHPLVFFEAPTGFGKTGVLLEFALGQLRSGHFDRALYLTSKSTGQLQVVRTLQAMTAASSSQPSTLNSQLPATPVAAWHVRNKSEHCVNSTFHCVRETCAYLDQLETRWPSSGLARFYLDERHARDLDTLRAAGRAARICPYEITRAALAFNDVWIGDYNYVFAPRNRGLFFEQPGWNTARTLLLLDEAHNLPARVADAYSHAFTADSAYAVRDELHRIHAPGPVVTAWDHWCHFLQHLPKSGALPAADEDDARHLLAELARLIPTTPLDYATLSPAAADLLWQLPFLSDALNSQPSTLNSRRPALSSELSALNSQPSTLNYLFWSPRPAELSLTCLDAAPAIGAALREFGGAVFASATLSPADTFAAACGLDTPPSVSSVPSVPSVPFSSSVPARLGSLTKRDTRKPTQQRRPEQREGSTTPPLDADRLGSLTKRDTRKLYRQLTTAADLLRVEEENAAAAPTHLRAHAPWRDGAYDVAFDARVDTTFQHRAQSYTITAATIAALCAAARASVPAPSLLLPSAHPATPCVAVFFPSYAYAETIAQELATLSPSELPPLNSHPSTPNSSSFPVSQLSTLNSQLPIPHSQLPPLNSPLRLALQPRRTDLAAQAAWVEASLLSADALFLVLGSSFAESIDLLGGRITHAMVIGPALPEVNPVQHARLAAFAPLGRAAAFRRVYQIPGMTKVNQALGRLVRAPGQRARVLLHCRRFVDPGYASLLSPEYQSGTELRSDADLSHWLARPEKAPLPPDAPATQTAPIENLQTQ